MSERCLYNVRCLLNSTCLKIKEESRQLFFSKNFILDVRMYSEYTTATLVLRLCS